MMGGQFNGHPWTANGTWAFKVDDPTHPLNQAFGEGASGTRMKSTSTSFQLRRAGEFKNSREPRHEQGGRSGS